MADEERKSERSERLRASAVLCGAVAEVKVVVLRTNEVSEQAEEPPSGSEWGDDGF